MKSIFRAALVISCLLAASPVAAAILAPGATVKLLATGFNFTESPLYDGAGGVYVSDLWPSNNQAVNPSRIYRYNIATNAKTIVDFNSGTANGTIFDPSGAVISADRDRRQISLRFAINIATVKTVLTSSYSGVAYNGPNDLIRDAHGGIYFTDPDFENRFSLPDALYYRSPAGTVSQLRTFASPNHRPNGVVLSPSGDVLYLSLWNNRQILAYDVAADGSLSNDRQFAVTNRLINGTSFTGQPDGMTVDADGNLFAAVGNRVFVWNPAGTRLVDIALPIGSGSSTNVDIGGANGDTLFITAGTSLYSIQLVPIQSVPEPSSLALLLVGCLMMAWRGLKKV